MVKIVSYKEEFLSQINEMIKAVALEFEEEIFSSSKNKTMSIPDIYWVAIYNDKIIGTIGLKLVNSDFSILKNMMLKKEFRGKENGVSQLLIETAINWNIENKISKMYLGTMLQFKAAQMFYTSNEFVEISEKELPIQFTRNPLDKIFFMRDTNKKAQPFG